MATSFQPYSLRLRSKFVGRMSATDPYTVTRVPSPYALLTPSTFMKAAAAGSVGFDLIAVTSITQIAGVTSAALTFTAAAAFWTTISWSQFPENVILASPGVTASFFNRGTLWSAFSTASHDLASVGRNLR